MDVQIEVEPCEALVDDIVHIKITRLNPQQLVSICSKVENRGHIFGSYAHYTASNEGVVNAKEDSAASSGMYSGVEPMGLFWSNIPCPGQRPGGHLVVHDANGPLVFEISVYTGYISWENLWDDGVHPVAKETILRWYKAKDVTKVDIEEGQIRGTLFLPRLSLANEKRPGVVDMFGIRGGLVEMRAALLASRGFVALALAYFDYKDTPKGGSYLHYEYFEEAIQWLSNHPSVIAGGVGLIGVSLGSQIALYMATHCPLLRAAVAINFPPIFVNGVKFKHAGKPVSTTSPNHITMKLDTSLGFDMAMPKQNSEDFNFFPFETENNPHILLIIGEKDVFLNPSDFSKWIETLPPERAANVEMCVYPGAGHLIEPPYSPLCATPFIKMLNMIVYFGGEIRAHAVAQESSWKKILEFLWSKLLVPSSDASPCGL